MNHTDRIARPAAPGRTGGEEITPTMKLRRFPIITKYADVIDSLYTGAGESAPADRPAQHDAGAAQHDPAHAASVAGA